MGLWPFGRKRLLADRARLGCWGQKRCERRLCGRGWRTLCRNYSCKTGEIDLVMVDTNGALVFVEVKTRAGEEFTAAESCVSVGKRARMARAARYFLACNDVGDRPYRFDVVTVVLPRRGKTKIEHFEGVFTL